MNVILFLFLFVIVKSNEFGLKNILEREKEIEEKKNKNELRFVIKEELEKFYSDDIEIYISLIEPKLVNSIKIKNDTIRNFKQNYYDKYEDIIGGTRNFFPLENINKVLFNTSIFDVNNNLTTFINQSEILRSIYKNKIYGENIKIYLIRNIFFNHFSSNCEFSELSWNNFYDLNLILTNNETDDFNCKNELNDLVQNNNLKFRKVFYEDLNDYSNIEKYLLENKPISLKINRKEFINSILKSRMYDRKVNYILTH